MSNFKIASMIIKLIVTNISPKDVKIDEENIVPICYTYGYIILEDTK